MGERPRVVLESQRQGLSQLPAWRREHHGSTGAASARIEHLTRPPGAQILK